MFVELWHYIVQVYIFLLKWFKHYYEPVDIKNAETGSQNMVPKSVNYHFTRQCNYQCGFCFHTAKNSVVLPVEKAKHGLKLLKDAGNKL